MDKVALLVFGFALGFVISWWTFAPAVGPVEEAKTEEVVPVMPEAPEAETVPPVEVVPMPPQEVVEPVQEKAAE